MSFLLSVLRWRGAPAALASAVLFGASTPLAKLLLDGVSPWMLAGLLYLGSGTGLGMAELARRLSGAPSTEAPLRRADLPWLAVVALIGGVIAPVLLMAGLDCTEASTAALLLNLEGLATMAIAWLVYHENVDRRILAGAAAILAGATLLSWDMGSWDMESRNMGDAAGGGATGFGVLMIVGACLAWGLDNNFTRKLSSANPLQIAMIKGLVAGAVNVMLALSQGAASPPALAAAGAGVVGFLGYGVSVALFVLALRHLGTARTSAYFSTAPFIGAILAMGLFSEPLTLPLAAAAALMGTGVYLHLTEHHSHEHTHEPIDHEHVHWHDEHHRHDHGPDAPAGEPHSHRHRHDRLTHSHPHHPDLHHQHDH